MHGARFQRHGAQRVAQIIAYELLEMRFVPTSGVDLAALRIFSDALQFVRKRSISIEHRTRYRIGLA